MTFQNKKSKSNYIKSKKKSSSLLPSPWKHSSGAFSGPSAATNSFKEIPMLNVFLHRLNQHGNGNIRSREHDANNNNNNKSGSTGGSGAGGNGGKQEQQFH